MSHHHMFQGMGFLKTSQGTFVPCCSTLPVVEQLTGQEIKEFMDMLKILVFSPEKGQHLIPGMHWMENP